ncbi:MAG: helix-turn-helix domain-containing protein [Solirubrobacterales bacterium]
MSTAELFEGGASGSPFTVLTGLLAVIADPVRLALVRGLAEGREATAAELSGRCQASGQTIRRHLEALVSSGVVVETAGVSDSATPGRPAARFSLHPEARESLVSLFGPSP